MVGRQAARVRSLYRACFFRACMRSTEPYSDDAELCGRKSLAARLSRLYLRTARCLAAAPASRGTAGAAGKGRPALLPQC